VKREERRAMSRLIDEFGADVLVNLQPPVTRTPRARALIRNHTVEAVADCRACGLCDTQLAGDERGPDFPSITAPFDLTVVTPFPIEGRYKRMLRTAVGRWVNIERVAWVPVTGCVPRAEGGTIRAASDIERTACSFHLHAGLEAAGAPNVLIVGEKALRAWRPDLKLSQVDGVVGVWNNKWMVTTVKHPLSAATPAEKKDWTADTSRAVHRLINELVGGIGERCTARDCAKPFKAWDQDALPWCEEHLAPKAHKPTPMFVNERLW
jgi:hypothetical protein